MINAPERLNADPWSPTYLEISEHALRTALWRFRSPVQLEFALTPAGNSMPVHRLPVLRFAKADLLPVRNDMTVYLQNLSRDELHLSRQTFDTEPMSMVFPFVTVTR